MATRTPAPRKSTTPARRALLEYVAPESGPALKVDREQGVVYGVRVLGRFSRNSHGQARAENGTEYSRSCMESALPLYEGAKVKIDHPPDRTRPQAERPTTSLFGVLRNCRVESDEAGDPCVRADLHYLKSHDLAESVCEDVERRLGVYGLSHNAAAARERFDPASRRLVIESLALVRSVDLVDKPATNRNLWESDVSTPAQTTPRQLLEAWLPKKSAARKAVAAALLEDDEMGLMEAPTAAPEAADPDEAMWSGFSAAITAILDKYKAGELDASAATKEVGKYVKAHEKLTGAEEPEADVEEEEEEDDKGKEKPGEKDKQESEELKTLRAEKAARELCESLDFAPTAVQLEAVAALPEKKRKPLIESFKATAKGTHTGKAPKSGFAPKQTPRQTTESEKPDPAADRAALYG